MRAITVQQPWAEAIATGSKNVENRSANFPQKYRGPLLIHAGARVSARGFDDSRVRADLRATRPGLRALLRSHFVATCELEDIHPDAGCCRPWGESSYRQHPGGEKTTVVHLVLAERRPLEIPWSRGQLGLWTPPPAALELLAAAG